MILPKNPPISYPGELPDMDHQTISLSTQLRLSYETYAWLRYISWTGLLILGALLILLPGFPPVAFVQIWQTLPITGSLVAQHGSATLFSLLALGLQGLTWLVLWGLFLYTCQALGRHNWRLYRSQAFLASGWQPSSVLGEEKTQRDRREQISLTTTHSLAPAPQRPVQNQPGRPVPVSLVKPEINTDTGRQFAQPSAPMARPRSVGDTSLSGLSGSWPLSSMAGGPGVAWDPGLKRQGRPNEDSVLTMRGTCNFADRLLPFELHIVADGMGGHAQGRLASHLAIRGMLETVIPGLVACNAIEGEQIVDILIDGVHWANQVIYQHGQEHGSEMGTTITAVLILDETAYIINVGDSRTYIYRPNAGLTQITRDHSLVARLVETGAITPDEVYTHPERNKVYRGLGDKTDVTVDWFVLPVQQGDLLMLCSDGLWEMVRDPKIAEILQMYANTPSLASHALLRAALQAGGSDNVSSLVVRVQP
jgi:serine/threonine protein phosphatase PrpC